MLGQKDYFFFDMDGLLFDTEKIYFETRKQALNKYGYSFEIEDYYDHMGKGYDTTIEQLSQIVGSKQLGYEVFQENMRLYNQKMTDGEYTIKTGALPLLKKLKELNKEAWLVSSSDYDQIRTLLEDSSLYHYFKGIVSGDHVERNKPYPDIYLYALEKAQAQSAQSVVLEDSVSGVTAGLVAGIDVIMIPDLAEPTAELKRKVNYILTDLNQVLELL